MALLSLRLPFVRVISEDTDTYKHASTQARVAPRGTTCYVYGNRGAQRHLIAITLSSTGDRHSLATS